MAGINTIIPAGEVIGAGPKPTKSREGTPLERVTLRCDAAGDEGGPEAGG